MRESLKIQDRKMKIESLDKQDTNKTLALIELLTESQKNTDTL